MAFGVFLLCPCVQAFLAFSHLFPYGSLSCLRFRGLPTGTGGTGSVSIEVPRFFRLAPSLSMLICFLSLTFTF